MAVVAGLADGRVDSALALAIRIALRAAQRSSIRARARVARMEVARGALLRAVRERTCFAIEILRCRDSVRALFQARAAGLAARAVSRPRSHAVDRVLASVVALAQDVVVSAIGMDERLTAAEVVRRVLNAGALRFRRIVRAVKAGVQGLIEVDDGAALAVDVAGRGGALLEESGRSRAGQESCCDEELHDRRSCWKVTENHKENLVDKVSSTSTDEQPHRKATTGYT